jgi:hypothetical protein
MFRCRKIGAEYHKNQTHGVKVGRLEEHLALLNQPHDMKARFFFLGNADR